VSEDEEHKRAQELMWPELVRGMLGLPPLSPLRALRRGQLAAMNGYSPRRAVMLAAEERDRYEWTEGIRRRLGLVTEVHRCQVYGAGGGMWAWMCQRSDCDLSDYGYRSQPEALARALSHARSYVPQPPKPEAWTELDLLAFEAAWDAVRDQQERIAAALPARMAAVAGEINATLSGVLPEGMRFEWS